MGREEKKLRKMFEEFGRGHEERKLRQRASKERRRARKSQAREREPDWSKVDPDELDEPAGRQSMRPKGARGLDDWVQWLEREEGGAGASSEDGGSERGVVVRVDRTRARVRTEEGDFELEVARGLSLAVGDDVRIDTAKGRVAARGERRSALSRPDPGGGGRELVLCANVDLIGIVASVRTPPLRPGLVDRLWIGAQRGGADTLLCVNKADLVTEDEREELLRTVLAPYRDLDLPVVFTSAETGLGIDALRARLAGRTCAFVGHSGVGKSSLLNALAPELGRETSSVSTAHGKGRHTTTASELIELADGVRLIDTPGVRAFGLEGIPVSELPEHFPELAEPAARCRFRDCSHTHEPRCAVRDAVERGEIVRARYDVYVRLVEEARG